MLVARSPPVLIEAVAGLALIGAFGGAMLNAVQDEEGRLPGLVTFLVTASGLSLFGIGSAFWGLVFGLAVHHVLARSELPAMTERPSLPQSIMTGLAGRCPRCRKGICSPAFSPSAKNARRAGSTIRFADAGDGPAIFVILISGFIVVGAALIVEVDVPAAVLAACACCGGR